MTQLHVNVWQYKSYVSPTWKLYEFKSICSLPYNKSIKYNTGLLHNVLSLINLVEVIFFLQNVHTFFGWISAQPSQCLSDTLYNATFSLPLETILLGLLCCLSWTEKNPSFTHNHMPFNWSGLESRPLCLLVGCTSKASLSACAFFYLAKQLDVCHKPLAYLYTRMSCSMMEGNYW